MKVLFGFWMVFSLSSCTTAQESAAVRNGQQSTTSISGVVLQDLDQNFKLIPVKIADHLGLQKESSIKLAEIYKNKWVVLNVIATWCGYSKMQLVYFEHEIVNAGFKDVHAVNVTIDFHSDAKPVRNQSEKITLKFIPEFSKSEDGVSLAQSDFYHLKGFSLDDLKKVSLDGKEVFQELMGYPYQLIFNPNGELVFAGHFTNALASDNGDWRKAYERHYAYMKSLISAK